MKLSQLLSQLLVEYSDRPLPLSAVLEKVGNSGFGTISGILIVPMLIPLPIPVAGFSTLFGSGILLVGCQLALGYEKPYLPKRIAQIQLSPAASQKILKQVDKLLQPLERMSKHRFSKFSNSEWGCRISGACLAWAALLMSLPLPIPLTNLVPAYTILFLAIGLLEFDGLFILIGYGMTVVTTIFFASIAGTIWQLASYWLQVLIQSFN